MTDEPSPEGAALPPGETDPNLLYIAVGRAIHAWEGMESALANLFLKLVGTQFHPSALVAYGKAHARFTERKVAVDKAAKAYFVKRCDQTKEGHWLSILADLDALAIERHRIAHGHIAMWGTFELPSHAGSFEVTVSPKYYWAAPWYSTATLRTNAVGTNAAGINVMHDRFSDLENRIVSFSDSL